MMYRLIILTGPLKNQRITVTQEPMVFGRDPGCAVTVPDDEISRKHALLEHKPDGLFIRDLGSMNKILVNNREVREIRLKHGDVIELGRTRFLVQAFVQAEVDAEAAPAGSNIVTFIAAGAVFVILMGTFAGIILWPKSNPLKTAAATPSAGTNAAPAAMPAKAAAVAPEVTEDLQKLKKEVVSMQHTVEDLARKQTMASNPPAKAPTKPAPAAKKPAPPPAPPKLTVARQVRLASIDQQKFQANEDFEEMRILNIGLVPDSPTADFRADSVQVQVSFFDEDEKTGAVSPTRAITPKAPLKPDGLWGQEEASYVSATYLVPRGLRQQESRGGQASRFYGYVVRVYYDGKLQDQDARPKTLLRPPAPARPAGAEAGGKVPAPAGKSNGSK